MTAEFIGEGVRMNVRASATLSGSGLSSMRCQNDKAKGQGRSVDVAVDEISEVLVEDEEVVRKTNPSLKFIFVSGYPNDAFKESLGEEEFAFLPKPFSLPQLAAKVKEELGR